MFSRDILLILRTHEISLHENNSYDLHIVITHSHVHVILCMWYLYNTHVSGLISRWMTPNIGGRTKVVWKSREEVRSYPDRAPCLSKNGVRYNLPRVWTNPLKDMIWGLGLRFSITHPLHEYNSNAILGTSIVISVKLKASWVNCIYLMLLGLKCDYGCSSLKTFVILYLIEGGLLFCLLLIQCFC